MFLANALGSSFSRWHEDTSLGPSPLPPEVTTAPPGASGAGAPLPSHQHCARGQQRQEGGSRLPSGGSSGTLPGALPAPSPEPSLPSSQAASAKASHPPGLAARPPVCRELQAQGLPVIAGSPGRAPRLPEGPPEDTGPDDTGQKSPSTLKGQGERSVTLSASRPLPASRA